MNTTIGKVAKAVAGLVLLFILLIVVNRWYGEYKREAADSAVKVPPTAASQQGSGTPTPTAGKPAKPKVTLIVLTDGLNFREQPTRDGNPIRGLSKGEKLALISASAEPGWYNVQDAKGVKGWISSNSSYTKVQK